MSTDTPQGSPPAQLGDPTDAVDPQPAQVDPSGQTAPAPDTVGVSEGQFGVQQQGAGELPTPPPLGPPPTQTTTSDAGSGDFTLSTSDQPTSDAASSATQLPEDTAPADDSPAPTADPAAPTFSRAFTTSPPPPEQLENLPAWAENETADPAVIRAIQRGVVERPEDSAPAAADLSDSDAVAADEFVYIRPNDPKFGANVSRHLEGMAARDARLGPLLDRLAILDNVYLRFPSDHYVLSVPEERTSEVPVTA